MFNAMLTGEFSESRHKEVILKEPKDWITYEVFITMLGLMFELNSEVKG